MSHTQKELAEHAQRMQTRVEELFKELMPDVTLVKVLTKPAKNYQWDDDYIEVTVVVDGTDRLDPDKTVKLRTRAWESADGEYDEEDPHPIFYFKSMQDAKELGLVS